MICTMQGFAKPIVSWALVAALILPSSRLAQATDLSTLSTSGSGMGSGNGSGSSQTEAKKKEKSDPCKKKKDQSSANSEMLQQAAQYCAAAEAADKAAKSQLLLAGVHAGVAGLCLIPCASNAVLVGDITSGHLCSAAAIGAGVTDMITTKQFTGAVGTLMGAYGLISRWGSVGKAGIAAEAGVLGTAANKDAVAEGYKELKPDKVGSTNTQTATRAQDAGKQAKADQAKKDGKMSCFTAAVEAGTAIMNYIGHQNSKKTADENRKRAKELEDVTPGISGPGTQYAPVASTFSNSNPSTFGAGGNTGGGNTPPGNAPPAILSRSDADNSSKATSAKLSKDDCMGSGFRADKNCAIAAGIPLPRGTAGEGFNRALEKQSGLGLDQLMARGNPKSIIGAVSGAALGPQKSAAVQAALDQAEADLRRAMGVPSSVYSGGGGGGGGGADSPDLGNALGALMEGLQDKPSSGPEMGANESLGQKHYESEGLEEDRSVSIFERISKRYQATSNRVIVRGYVSPQNQVLSR